MSPDTDTNPAQIVLVCAGREDGLRLRYTAKGADRVEVHDVDADDASVADVTDLMGPSSVQVAFHGEYVKRLGYYEQDVRETAQRHAWRTSRTVWRVA